MTTLKLIGLVAFGTIILVAVLAFGVGIYKTNQVEHQPNQSVFLSGSVPAVLPDGFYKGNQFTGFGASWQGKVFDAANGQGINQFTEGQRFRFKFYPAKGLRDKKLQVLRIDYNQPGNPWWLRFITDEIVQTAPGHFLGKVHLRIIPGITFTISYFELSAPK